MKKLEQKNIGLSRETLHRLDIQALRQAGGAVYTHPPVCESTGNCA